LAVGVVDCSCSYASTVRWTIVHAEPRCWVYPWMIQVAML